MSRADMAEVRLAYVRAARLALAAGFQGIEIHFGHGHLLHQFISPAANTRQDPYGGGFENRMRFPLEVLDAVLDEAGPSAVVGVRLSADELVAGGQGLDEGRAMAELLAGTRPVGYLSVSVASYTVPSIGHHVADMSEGHAPYLAQQLAVAESAGDVPVLVACRFADLADAERALETGRVAAVAMTRAHIADPHLIRKAAEGRESQIRPCVSCNFCIGRDSRPSAHHLHDESDGRARVTMAARHSPGGTPPVRPRGRRRARRAGSGPGRGRARPRRTAVGASPGTRWPGPHRAPRRGPWRAGPATQLRRAATAAARRAGPHRRGGNRRRDPGQPPRRRGHRDRVLATRARRGGLGDALTVDQALAGRRWEGRTVVIVDEEGAWPAASAAETIARSGGTVHVVTAAGTPFWGITEYSRMTAVERLLLLGVQIWPHSTVTFNGGAVISSTMTTVQYEMSSVTDVVLARPPVAEDALGDVGLDAEVHVIGDACAPRSCSTRCTKVTRSAACCDPATRKAPLPGKGGNIGAQTSTPHVQPQAGYRPVGVRGIHTFG